MKVSNETKVGALTAVAITLLILGFNYLKGKNITTRSDTIYAIFPSVAGVTPSTAVFINGLQVGRVSELEEKDKNMSGIIVTIHLSKEINIPNNSYATIDRSLLGSSNVSIVLGNSAQFIADGDTLLVREKPDLVNEFKTSLDPAIDNINKTLVSLDAVIQKLNSIIDPNVKNNLQSDIAKGLNNPFAAVVNSTVTFKKGVVLFQANMAHQELQLCGCIYVLKTLAIGIDYINQFGGSIGSGSRNRNSLLRRSYLCKRDIP